MTTIDIPQVHSEQIVKLRHPGRWIGYVVLAVALAALLHSTVTNQNFGWDVVGHYFFSSSILHGLARTLELTVIAMGIGVAAGVIVALMRLSSDLAMSSVASAYIWFFRGTPLFVQILFWGYVAALYPTLSLSIPFGPQIISGHTNTIVTPFLAAILGLGLHEGAYMAEIIRAGVLSVDHGQTEAAQALGMSHLRTLRRITLPQAMRVIIPPTGNRAISMLKNTALVSVLAYPELLYSAQLIYSKNFETIPLLITASIWYLLMTSLLTVGQFYLERPFSRGDGHSARRKAILGRRLMQQLRLGGARQ